MWENICMARFPRLVLQGLPHHVTHRGNKGIRVFHCPADYRRYAEVSARYLLSNGVDVISYCMMPNHVHLILVPVANVEGLSLAMHDILTAYALSHNRRSGSTGHLWQGRFYSCAMDDWHLLNAVRYTEMNPVRAGLVRRPVDYPWSSAFARSGAAEPLIPLCPLPAVFEQYPDWEYYLESGESEDFDSLRDGTRIGRPLLSIQACREIESTTGRIVLPRRRSHSTRDSF